MLEYETCVIGAGPSGLTAAKSLQDRGVPFVCFEKGSQVGGLWRYNNDSGSSAAYRSLHINTSKSRTEFSCFAMPEAYPDFPHHSQMAAYFDSFTDHFQLREHIVFRSSVESVRRLPDGTFGVTWRDENGTAQHQVFRSVVVANGHHSHPHRPSFPGTFSGLSLHSHEYKTPDDLRDKRVLVVGMGNSGCDIACDTGRVSAQTFLSTRRGAHIIPKYLFGKPLDRFASEAAWRYLPKWLFQRMFAVALKFARGKQERFGIPKPKHGILSEHPTISSDLINMVGHGGVRMKPNVARFEDDTVVFDDGSREQIDVVIFATGYDIRFPFLEERTIDVRENRIGLYKMVVHPEQEGLYFVGLIQPWGSIMPLAERQSEWVADIISGRVGLPSREEMRGQIDRTQRKMQKRYTSSRRHTIQVDYHSYLDELERECRRGRRRASRARAQIASARKAA